MTWKWDSPKGIDVLKFTIQQTDSIDSISPTVNGFASPVTGSGQGQYQYKFTEEGVFYYWSRPVDPNGKLSYIEMILNKFQGYF